MPADSAHVLVTGGSGFIGNPLSLALLAEGYRVTVLTRSIGNTRKKLPSGIHLIDSLTGLHGMPAVEAVVNLAGEPLADRRWTRKRKALFFQSRVGTTEALFDYFSRQPVAPKVLINGSAIGYYGAHGDEVLDETGSPNACFSHQLCAAWETAADRFASLDARVCKIRIGIVLAADGGALKAMLPAFRLGLGGPFGNGRQWMSWIHRDDLVAAILLALRDNDLNGAINGTAPHPVINQAFARTLGKTLSRPAKLAMPAWLVRLLFGEMAEELLLSGQRVYPRKLEKAGLQFVYPNLEKALTAILSG